jgi:exopolysaccharide biosynthesis polyprenyl glycosylphosphotransferase
VRVCEGYDPPEIHVEAGQPVRVIFCRQETTPYSQSVAFPEHGVTVELPPFQEVTVDLPPSEPGTYRFACQPPTLQGKLVVEPSKHDASLTVDSRPDLAASEPKPPYRTEPGSVLQRLLEEPGWKIVSPIVDFVLLWFAVTVAQGGLSFTPATAPLLALPPLTMVMFFLHGTYRSRLRTLVLDGMARVISGVSIATMAVATLSVLVDQQVPGKTVLYTWIYALALVSLGHAVLANAQRWARKRKLIGKPVLIMGAGVIGTQLARQLEDHTEYGLVPVGFVDDDPQPTSKLARRDVPVLGTFEELDEIVGRTHARHLIVAFSLSADARMSRLVQHCQERGIEVSVVPRMFETINQRVGYEAVGGVPVLSFTMVDPKGWQFAIKYALDRIIAAAILLTLAPLLAVITLMVKLSTGGPVLFRQPRVGLDGQQFDMFKFRTMKGSPDRHGENDANWAEQILRGVEPISAEDASERPPDSDRRTPIGHLLRRLSLDELPQFWNVLNGDMSLIGPRPERVSYVRRFEPVVYRYGERHRVKSGITGWAQVHGLRGRTSLAERIQWDNYYIAHWSLGLDLKILLLTIAAAFRNAE